MTTKERTDAACLKLLASVSSFIAHARAGQVKEMLAHGVAVQVEMEKVAKVVTGTEVPT